MCHLKMFPTTYDFPITKSVICNDLSKFFNICSTMNDENKTMFRVKHLNIRSFNKNIEFFLVFLEGLNVRFQCIILTEVWLKNNNDLINIPVYNLNRSYNSLNKSDGVILYLDNSLMVACNQLVVGGVATSLSVTFIWDGIQYDLLVIYHSPNSHFPTFTKGPESYYDEISRHSKLLVTCKFAGDINSDIMQIKQNSMQKLYFDIDTVHLWDGFTY